MDQSEQYHKLQSSAQLNKYHDCLKKTLQFVVPISLLSIFLISYSLGFSFFIQHFNYQFSAFLFPLLTHTLERKYIFLICNGILAFLVKNSGLGTTPSGSPTMSNTDFTKSVEAALDQDVEKQEYGYLNSESEEREGGDFITESEENDDEVVEENGCLVPPSATEEGNEVADISTEELNRKFDEFIRKMKEEIRIEAQRPLIAV